MRLVTELACPDCDVTVHVLHESGAEIAASYGIKTVPAVIVDGRVVICCDNADPTVKNSLKQAWDGRWAG